MLAKQLNRARTIPGAYKEIKGIEQFDKVINIDQSPIAAHRALIRQLILACLI